MSVFLSRMERAAAANAANATFAANVPFYDESGAKLDALILRARATEPQGRCLGAEGVAALAAQLLKLKPFAAATADLHLETAIQGAQSDAEGSCTVQILRVIRANHALTAIIHQHNDKLTPPVITIIKPTLEQGVRIGVITELAKQRGTR